MARRPWYVLRLMPWSTSRIPRLEIEPMVLAAVDFFNHLNMLYGTVTEFCTPKEVSESIES